jgi:hypothetical protein
VISDKFSRLDFYDDKLLSIQIRLAQRPGKRTQLSFVFADDGTGKVKTLSITDPANIRLNADFDVLADNWFALTGQLSAHSDVARMKNIVKDHVRHWRAKYLPPTSKTKPIDKKLARIGAYTLFKIALHGGTIEVLADNYRISVKR